MVELAFGCHTQGLGLTDLLHWGGEGGGLGQNTPEWHVKRSLILSSSWASLSLSPQVQNETSQCPSSQFPRALWALLCVGTTHHKIISLLLHLL